MMMPQKTDLKNFKGFGFGAKPGNSGPRPPGGAAKPGKAKASGVASLFQESMEDQDQSKKSALPSWAKITPEAAQAQRVAEKLVEEDPTVFQYDEILDDIKEEQGVEGVSDRVRADTMSQKKRVGLHVPQGAETVKTGTKRSAKYVEKVMIATDRRKVEQQMVEDRLLKKEKEARQDAEVFVTEGFKEELKRRKKFEEELEAQEERDQRNAAEKQEHGTGFASMYRNLLNTGLASSRGGEKVREMAPAKEEAEAVQEEAKAAKDEDEDEEKLKAELAPLVEKDELPDSAGHGVQDAAFTAAPGSKEEEKEKWDEKALSAKERYLLRKKGLLAPEGS